MKLRTAFDHMVPRHVLLVASCTGVADRYPMTKHLEIPKKNCTVSVFLDVYALSRFGIFEGLHRYPKQISHDIP